MTTAALEAVPLSYTGMASAALSTARDFGMCAGPAAVSAIAVATLSPSAPYDGYAIALVVCSAAAVPAT
ncbi:hypothetical protein [Actinomadura parmotrematis]|uniref:Uncharacterized protein n=1 Tax=Actinomadura parmotrematis TaxID=2864039 RepID=A0ABS7G326_9ACTN|nr:hypothetical protein [Actinomadura parmotrematis]MBW8486745.1 hypothetical protein [Actinomadura parmotrematis]